MANPLKSFETAFSLKSTPFGGNRFNLKRPFKKPFKTTRFKLPKEIAESSAISGKAVLHPVLTFPRINGLFSPYRGESRLWVPFCIRKSVKYLLAEVAVEHPYAAGGGMPCLGGSWSTKVTRKIRSKPLRNISTLYGSCSRINRINLTDKFHQISPRPLAAEPEACSACAAMSRPSDPAPLAEIVTRTPPPKGPSK